MTTLAKSIANVAPTTLENETKTIPIPRPKMAPPARVKIVAPGRENAVTTMYTPI